MNEQPITFKDANPTNVQKPNYSGSCASGAKGKPRPLNTDKTGEKDDN